MSQLSHIMTAAVVAVGLSTGVAWAQDQQPQEQSVPANPNLSTLAQAIIPNLSTPATEPVQCRQTRLSEQQKEELGLNGVCAMVFE